MKNYCSVLLILLLPLIALLGYASMDEPVTTELKRINITSLDTLFTTPSDPITADDSTSCDSVETDTLPQRILFFGDSMVEGPALRLAQYANYNGHELTFISWYSSTTKMWASDTLRHYLREADPTLVMIGIGGNEQTYRDTEFIEKNIRNIISIIGDIPYVWICTPEWEKDAPFNFIPERICGKKRFFDSRRLILDRAADHRHPTFKASRAWMDSIAVWMQSQQTAHPIVLKCPPEGTKTKCVKHILKMEPAKKSSGKSHEKKRKKGAEEPDLSATDAAPATSEHVTAPASEQAPAE